MAASVNFRTHCGATETRTPLACNRPITRKLIFPSRREHPYNHIPARSSRAGHDVTIYLFSSYGGALLPNSGAPPFRGEWGAVRSGNVLFPLCQMSCCNGVAALQLARCSQTCIRGHTHSLCGERVPRKKRAAGGLAAR